MLVSRQTFCNTFHTQSFKFIFLNMNDVLSLLYFVYELLHMSYFLMNDYASFEEIFHKSLFFLWNSLRIVLRPKELFCYTFLLVLSI